MIHIWMCGGRTCEPVSEAKSHFCETVEAEAGSRRPEATDHV